jgi:GNAT superfamily N-acetyltransferase
MIRIRKAKQEDAEQLTDIQIRTFRHDNMRKPRGCSLQGPPGHDSVAWNARMIRDVWYYVIEYDGRTVGGIIVFGTGSAHYDLGRIFVEPDLQNRGIGKQAMQLVFSEFPRDALWTVGTPEWAISNHRFYESIGFHKVGETPVDPDLGWAGFEYERHAG